jgi:hypothetical protein
MNLLDQKVKNHSEDIKLHYQGRIEGIKIKSEEWNNWTLWSECSTSQREESNLRGLFSSELLLDLEEKKRLLEILSKLKNDNLSGDLWNSRKGYHFHLEFPEMKTKSEQERKLIREYYIKRYNTDLSKRSGMVAQEFKPYFKNEKIVKKLIQTFGNFTSNKLSKECLDYVKNKLKSSSLHGWYTDIKISKCPLIEYSLKNKLKGGTGRGRYFAKNIAIFFLKESKEKAKNMLNKFYSAQGIVGGGDWVEWACSNNHNNFSCKELRGWLRETQKSDVEELTCWRCVNGKAKTN